MPLHSTSDSDAAAGFRIIKSIRELQCVGVEGELGQATANLKQQLTAAAERLAEDLYATSTHFLMELLQNADDNEYAPGVQPYIQFFLRPQHLIISNNEVGFREENVRGLCALANSTKKLKQGYIGEKGIGFKSVFVWTDEPHVLSNGFDFKFKHGNITLPGELGFLVPYAPCIGEWPKGDMQYCSAPTMFYLPFRQRGDHSQNIAASELVKQFKSDMQPELVLFLRKLSTIKLWFPSTPNDPNDQSQVYVQYARTEKSPYDVEVTQTTTTWSSDQLGVQRALPSNTESHLCTRIHAAPTRAVHTHAAPCLPPCSVLATALCSDAYPACVL